MILATNTSALSVAEIAEATRRPDRVIGLHFFNPAPIMPLVEVVAPPLADPAVVARAVAIVDRLGQDAGPLRRLARASSSTGSTARSRIEALRILEAGAASVTEIDEALRDGGFPMGPFELMDLIGIDVNLAAATGIWEGLGRPDRLRPSPIQERLVAAGDLGRKTGQGFYRYEDGRPGRRGRATVGVRRGRAPQRRSQIRDRILDAIADEAQLAAAEGVASPDVIDLALRLGAGHPHGPFESRPTAILMARTSRSDAAYRGRT